MRFQSKEWKGSKHEAGLTATAVVMTMQEGIKNDINYKVRWYEAGAIVLFLASIMINVPWLLLMGYVQDNLQYEEP